MAEVIEMRPRFPASMCEKYGQAVTFGETYWVVDGKLLHQRCPDE